MLNTYFGLRFDAEAGTLTSIPELLDNYLPDMRLLPMFLLRLAIQVSTLTLTPLQSIRCCLFVEARPVAGSKLTDLYRGPGVSTWA